MALGPLALLDTFAIPRQTQTADTVIISAIPPRKTKRTKVAFLAYTSGGTAHTITLWGELSRCKTTAAVAGAATSIILDRDPGKYSLLPEWAGRGITPSTADNAIAANDYLYVQLTDGTFLLTKISAAVTNSDGTVTVTVSAVPGAGIARAATVWFMGAVGDTNPRTNAAHPTLKPTVSAQTLYPSTAAGGGSVVYQSFHMESPVIIYSDNPTAAGTLDYGSATYGT